MLSRSTYRAVLRASLVPSKGTSTSCTAGKITRPLDMAMLACKGMVEWWQKYPYAVVASTTDGLVHLLSPSSVMTLTSMSVSPASRRASMMSSETTSLSPTGIVPLVTLAFTIPSSITSFQPTGWEPAEVNLTCTVGQKVASAVTVQFQSSCASIRLISAWGGGGGGEGGGGGGGGNCPSYASTSPRLSPM